MIFAPNILPETEIWSEYCQGNRILPRKKAMKRHERLLLGLGICAVWGGGCTHAPWTPSGDEPPVVVVDCEPDVIYFQQDVLPLLQSACAQSGCHDASAAEDIRLDSYAAIFQSGESNLVVPGNPGASELWEVLVEDNPDKIMPPPPASALNAEQIGRIWDWIEQGALNLSCEGGCDTLNVTFSGTIVPLLADRCVSCHSGASPDGGVNLSTHAGVVSAVDTRGLVAAIRQTGGGVSAMPPSGTPLTECQIRAVELWIADGKPNN